MITRRKHNQSPHSNVIGDTIAVVYALA
jgi:hypothetical protein